MTTTAAQRPFSLRFRLLLTGAVILVAALGLVGYALDRAFIQFTHSGVKERLQSYVFLALAAADVNEDGSLAVANDRIYPVESRLEQADSGLYLTIQIPNTVWESASIITPVLPQVQDVPLNQVVFNVPDQANALFEFHQGVSWEIREGHTVPMTVSVWEHRRIADMPIQEFRAGLWRWLGSAALLLILAQLLFITWALRPLRRIAEDVTEIESGAAQDLSGRYPAEVMPLTRNVNRLLKSEYANQKRYRTALDALAHSLKTPLAVIRAALHQGSEESAAHIDSAVNDMQSQISRHLEQAASSARRTLAAPTPVKPEVLRIIDSLHKVYARRQVQCDVNIDDSVLFSGEQRDLLEILGNLLDNAFKYGDGRIQVSAENRTAAGLRPGLVLTVEDDGPGIRQQDWEDLLQRGVRGDERSQDGHGVGLAIVSELVESYDGSLNVAASALGGAVIKIVIPPS